MKTSLTFLSACAAVCLFSSIGCSKQRSSTPTAPAGSSSQASDDHGHDHPHPHGETDHSVAGHAHGEGPHQGTIADWGGGKYHVEFTVDHDKQQSTVYVLGGDEKTPSPIAAEEIELSITDPEMLVTLKADPHQDDPEGSSSRFVGNHEKLGVVQEYTGTITGVIDGTPFSGDFQEVSHSH